MTKVQLLGEEELQRCLKNLPYQIRRRLIISSLRTAAQPMRQQAISNAPDNTGTTKRAIVIVDAKGDVPMVMIGPTQGKRVKNNAWYSKFQEFGTKGFGKRTRRATGVRVNFKTGSVYRSRVTTGWKYKGGGLPAKRFMQRAFETRQNEVLGNIKNVLNKKVVSYLRRNAPKYVK